MHRETLKVQVLGPEDMYELIRLERQCFSSPWGEKEYIGAFASPHFLACGFSSGNTLLAFVSAQVLPGEMEIWNVGTDPQYRRQGLGKQVLSFALAEGKRRGATQSFLEVRENNTTALSLYTKLGFKISGRRLGYYADTKENAICMSLIFLDEE